MRISVESISWVEKGSAGGGLYKLTDWFGEGGQMLTSTSS